MADDPFLTIKDFYMQHGTFLNVYDDSVEETDEIRTIKDKRKSEYSLLNRNPTLFKYTLGY